MLDVGWSELLVIAVVLIVVVGPKDLPPMLRAFGKMTARLRAMAGEFRTQFDEALKEADLDEVRKTIGDAQRLNPMNTIREAITPLRQTADEIRSDLQKASASSPVTKTPVATEAVSAPASLPEGGETLPPPENQPAAPVAEVAAEAVPAGDSMKKDGA